MAAPDTRPLELGLSIDLTTLTVGPLQPKMTAGLPLAAPTRGLRLAPSVRPPVDLTQLHALRPSQEPGVPVPIVPPGSSWLPETDVPAMLPPPAPTPREQVRYLGAPPPPVDLTRAAPRARPQRAAASSRRRPQRVALAVLGVVAVVTMLCGVAVTVMLSQGIDVVRIVLPGEEAAPRPDTAAGPTDVAPAAATVPLPGVPTAGRSAGRSPQP